MAQTPIHGRSRWFTGICLDVGIWCNSVRQDVRVSLLRGFGERSPCFWEGAFVLWHYALWLWCAKSLQSSWKCETPPEIEAGRESQRSRARSPCATSLTTLHLDFRFGGVTPSYPIEATVSRVSCYMQPTASQLIQKVAADHIPPSHREKLRLRNVKCYMGQLVLSNPESEFLTTSLQSFQACLPLEAYTTI